MKGKQSLVPTGSPERTGGVRGLFLLGILAFLGFCVMLAPARILAPAVERLPGGGLRETAGTVWVGSGELSVQGQDWGRLSWSFRPLSLFRLFPSYSWTLSGAHLNLAGTLSLGSSQAVFSTDGTVSSAAFNSWLAAYDLHLEGEFRLQALSAAIADNRPTDAKGSIHWSGGRLRYVLAQRSRTVQMPALEAQLRFTDGPQATVFAAGDTTPLLKARLLDNGFAHIGITKRLTQMLNDPWPGTAADDEVVVAVEEKIL